MKNPKVSVVLITYNHEAYIEQAIESVLMQEADFAFELLISEDCSTDATRKIVMDLREKWPERIKLLLSDRNQFNNEVLTRCFPAAAGEYIALLEGDDFWISPKKLQEQVDYLEAHPEYVSCFHPVKAVYEGGTRKEIDSPFHPKRSSTLQDLLLHGCFIETASVMFRREAIRDVPGWYRDIFCGDWVLYVLLARRGDIGYIDEPMAVHRYHAGGVWTRLNSAERIKKTIEAYSEVQKYLGREVRPLRQVLARQWYGLAVERIGCGQVADAMTCASNGLDQCPYNPKLLLLRFMPRLWRGMKFLATSMR